MANVEVRHYSSILFTLLPPADLAANKHLSAALLKLAGSKLQCGVSSVATAALTVTGTQRAWALFLDQSWTRCIIW